MRIYELLRNSVDLRSGITIQQLQQQVQASQAVQQNIARELQAQQQEVASSAEAASKQQESCRIGQSSGMECITDSMYARGMTIQLYLPRAQAQANGLRPLQPAIIEIVGNGMDSPAQPGLNTNGQPLPPMTQSLSSNINPNTPIAIGSYLINTGGSTLGGPDNRRIITMIEINNVLAMNESGQIIQINYRNGIGRLMARTDPRRALDGQAMIAAEEARRVIPGNDIITDRRGETAAARRRAYFAHTLAENNQQGALLAQVVQEMLRRQREQRQRLALEQSQAQQAQQQQQQQAVALSRQVGLELDNMALADSLFNFTFIQRMHTQLNSLWYAGVRLDTTGTYRTVDGVREPPEEWFDRTSYLNQGRTTLGGNQLPQPRQTIVGAFINGLSQLMGSQVTNQPTLGDLWNNGRPLGFVEFITRYQIGGRNPQTVMRTAFGPDILPTGKGLHDLAQTQD